MNRIVSKIRLFTNNKRGVVAIIVAMQMVTLVGFAGVAIDSACRLEAQTDLQSAADAAALAAVKSAANGGSTQQYTRAAQNAWSANGTNAANSPNWSLSLQTANDVSTATVSYSACSQPVFVKVFGYSCIPVNGTAVAQAYQAKIASVGFSGTGNVWGDPHIVYADGSNAEISNCNTGNWYDLLSDSGIEVNITCQPWLGNGVPLVTGYSIVLGSHQISLIFPNSSIQASGSGDWSSYDPILIVDGVTQPAATTSPASFAGGQVTYTREWINQEQGSFFIPVLAINNGQYQFQVAFPNGGYILISASGAGTCGTPGGIWGPSLAGNDVVNAQGYQVSQFATMPEFGYTGCTLATLGPRLIQ